MQLHELKSNIKRKLKKRKVGRGGKRGTYSGKGMKGQRSRAGHRIRPQLRDIVKKIPKKRGYKFKSVRDKPAIINIDLLQKKFNDGETINPLKILRAGAIKPNGKKKLTVKILGDGSLNKKFTISGCELSVSAKEKILAAGGEIKN